LEETLVTDMDLSLVSIEDITKELDKRFDGYIFAYVRSLDSGREELNGYYWGGKATAIGLCEHMKYEILGDMKLTDDEISPQGDD
jgi:hypothetical protein